jgi:hypothetical protein
MRTRPGRRRRSGAGRRRARFGRRRAARPAWAGGEIRADRNSIASRRRDRHDADGRTFGFQHEGRRGAGEIGQIRKATGQGGFALAADDGAAAVGAEERRVVEQVVGEALGDDVEEFAAFGGRGVDGCGQERLGQRADADEAVGAGRLDVVGFGNLGEAAVLDDEGDGARLGRTGRRRQEDDGEQPEKRLSWGTSGTRNALDLLLQESVGEHEGRHGLDDRHRARQHAGIVAALGLEHDGGAVEGRGRLGQRNGGTGLKATRKKIGSR